MEFCRRCGAMRFDPEGRRAVVNAYLADEALTLTQLARKFEANVSTVKGVLRDAGIRIRSSGQQRSRKIPQLMRTRAAERLHRGEVTRQRLKRELRVSWKTLMRILAEEGVT